MGRRTAVLYYDCDREADRIADSGEEMPSFLYWLKDRNPLFEGEPYINHSLNPDDKGDNIGVINSKYRVYSDGLTYKGRPIMWFIGNHYCCMTGLGERKVSFKVLHDFMFSQAVYIPDFLDEAKSVYISEDMNMYKNLIMVGGLENLRPVQVFVYVHHSFFKKAKGARRTYFQGYNVPETFKMEDYSVLPPMDDFRRTIFWTPSVKTDKNGRATVEFYNNSTCREMYISAECITDDGCALSN